MVSTQHYLFGNLKRTLHVKGFRINAEIIAVSKVCFEDPYQLSYKKGAEVLEKCFKEFAAIAGDHVDK